VRASATSSSVRKPPGSASRFAEDGARSCRALGGIPARFWRLGALVFQPGLVRIGHQVSHSEEWKRIVVWAVRGTGPARGWKNVWGKTTCNPGQGNSTRWIFRFEGMPAGTGQSGCLAARPAVYPAPTALRLHPCRAVSSAEANSICSSTANRATGHKGHGGC